MLSVTGKGYSKMISQNPFHEDPLPRAFYHPSKKRPLTLSEKKLVLSPIRTEGSLPQVQDEAEKNFLAQSHTIRPFTSSPKQTPASPPSDKFDESWPDSERPSSPSFHAGHDNHSAEEDGRTVHAKMQHDAASRHDTASSKAKASQLIKSNYPSTLQDDIPEQLFPQVPIEEGSVLRKYIERFRHGTPTSREERMKLQEKKRELWGSSASSNSSTGSLAGKEGESQRRYTGLTAERLQEHDQQDEMTKQLQHKAERLLQSAQSLASSEPVVSTDGLGSTGSDISSFSEPAVRPSLLPRQTTGEVHHGVNDFRFGSMGIKRSEDDILYKWRLQHKMEQAKQFPLLRQDETTLHKTTPADEEVATRLKEFRKKLLQQTAVAAQVVREAQVERIVKETLTVMDSAVQTTPQTLPTLSTNEVLKVPMWSFSRKADSSVQTEDPQHVDLKKNVHILLQPSEGLKPKHANMSLQTSEGVDPCDSSQQPHTAAESSGAKFSCKGKRTEEDIRIDKCIKQVAISVGEGEKTQQPENQNTTQYRQFLKAEKPHVYDGGDTPEKNPDRQKYPPNVRGSRKKDATGKSLGFGRVASLPDMLQPNQNGEQTSLPSPSGDFVVQENKIQQGVSRGSQRLKEVSSFPRNLDVHSSQGESEMDGGKGSTCERSSNKYLVDSGDMPDLQQILRTRLKNTNKQPVKDTQVLSSTLEDFRLEKRFAPGQSHPDAGDRRGHGLFGEPGTPAQAKLRQKLEKSKVMPSPHFSSSPARTPVTAAIGQVVHDRLFDVSESLVSSVDSSCSLVYSSSHPFQTSQSHQLSLHDAEEYKSDGEFESDPLLQLLRQQRSQYENQLRYLDSVLSEMT